MLKIKTFLLIIVFLFWLIPSLAHGADIKKEQPLVFSQWENNEIKLIYKPSSIEYEKSKLPSPKRINSNKTVQYGYGYNCVTYARAVTGIFIRTANGQAKTHPVNSQTPTAGSLVVTYEGYMGHLAVVDRVDGNYIYVNEANYVRGQVTKGRAIPINSTKIKGYYVN